MAPPVPPAAGHYPRPMTRYHVVAGLPDSAEELHSLAVVEAASPDLAIQRCLHDIDDGCAMGGDPLPPRIADALRREHAFLRQRLREPGTYLVVTPVAAETHFMVDDDGVARAANEVERGCGLLELDSE